MRQFFFYPRRVTTLFVSSLLFVLLISIPGCKGGNPVSPIVIPNGEYDWTKTASPGDSSGITHRGTGSYSGGNLNMTGPEEYITSGLSPKLITTATPIFSASVSDVDADLTSDDFSATIDREQINCTWNQSTGEVTFQPTGELSDGPHRAQLFLKIPNGPMRMLHWNFMIRTRTPEIDFVMWNSESKWALVVFKDDIEPSVMLDNSRWNFNNQYNILRANVGSAGKNMALLPLSNTAFGMFTNPLGPLTLGFHDKTGPVMHVIRRGGGMEREVQAACENCSGISYYWYEPDHRYLEAGAEKYAFAYKFTNPNNCPAKMEWTDWTRTPVGHDDPANFLLNEDHREEGIPETGTSQNPYPEDFNMLISDGEPHTVSFDRLYRHRITVSVWVDCTPDYRPGSNPPDPYETKITEKEFVFGPASSLTPEGFDCKNPIFDHEPVVLYGDEAADMIETDWMLGVSLKNDNGPSGTWYCSALDQVQFEAMMATLREDSCSLYIVAQASDPIEGNRYGTINMPFSLDMIVNGEVVIDDPGGGQGTGIVLDHKPWAEDPYSNPDDYEIILNWPDHTFPTSTGGNFYHDGVAGESAIWWKSLSEMLLNEHASDDITDLRVRIVDDNPDPAGGGIDGNWRRSGNVLDQVCNQFGEDERSGQLNSIRKCEHVLDVEFIAINPHDHTSTGAEYKIVEFEANCDDRHTNFISRMTYNAEYQSWGAVVYLAGWFHSEDEVDPICIPPDSLKVQIDNLEETVFPSGLGKSTEATLNNIKIYGMPADLNIELGDLYYLFGLTNQRGRVPEEEPCTCEFYLGKIFVTDSLNTDIQDGILYMSNSDHMLTADNQKDYSITINTSWQSDSKYWSMLDYAPRRGLGAASSEGIPPVLNRDFWYGYDDFIISGGFEAIQQCFAFDPSNGYVFNLSTLNGRGKAIPIQSEADVLIIFAHGNYYSPSIRAFSSPEHEDCWLNEGPGGCDDESVVFRTPVFSFNRTCDFGYPADGDIQKDCVECYRRDDFIDVYGSNRASFWVKERGANADTKYLLLLACNTLTNNNPLNSREQIRKLMDSNDDGLYFFSACGFKKTSTAEGIIEVLKLYNDNMKYLSQSLVCCHKYSFWSSIDDYPPDPSITAFMEACAQLSFRPDFRTEISETSKGPQIHQGCAIAKSNNAWCSWHIVEQPVPVLDGEGKVSYRMNYRIKKLAVNEDPPSFD